MQTQIFNPFIFWSSTNLRFADDIDTLAEERELKSVVASHDKISVKGQRFETVTDFKYFEKMTAQNQRFSQE